jgi:uncharacterized membrane protein YsdA (DUF1294 family)
MLRIIIIYGIVINLIAFAMYGIDKLQARRGGRRTPERTLLILSAIGGSMGAIVAMQLLRHKTQHAWFHYGVPVMLLTHAIVITYILVKYYA